MLKFWIGIGLISLGSLACIETEEAPEPQVQTEVQAVVETNSPNWFLAGDEGLVELAGGNDGEPDVLTGRFVLDGNSVNDASFDGQRWVLVGDGRLQAVDTEVNRLRDMRMVFEGAPVNFIRKANVGWVIGGQSGNAMVLDAEGEPTETEAVLLDGENLVDAAFNGLTWLFASEDRVATANASLESGTVNDVLETRVISAVATAGTPSSGAPSGWIVFGGDSFEFVRPTGVPQDGVQLIEAGIEVTDAVFQNGKILVGTADGRVGIMDPATRTFDAWNQVFNQAVQKIEVADGQSIVLGREGQVRLLDATGAPSGQAVDLATSRTPVAAWLVDESWRIALGEIGFVEFVGDDLTQLRTLDARLEGRTVRGGDVATDGVLLVGDEGRIQLFDLMGAPKSDAQTLETDGTLYAAAFNGTDFLVAGENGFTQLVGQDGTPKGTPNTLLDSKTIRFVSWGPGFWLIGGDDGTYERVRPDGTSGGAPVQIEGVETLYTAKSNAVEWMVAGLNTQGTGVYVTVASNGNLRDDPVSLSGFEGPVYAVEFNGLEWILAGAGGSLIRLNNEGVALGSASNVFNGYDIFDISYNGSTFLISGQFGSVRRLAADLRPVRAPIAVINQRDIYFGKWTRARGFAGGLCVSNARCFNAPCVGGVESGQCCDSACDSPCESCVLQDTGEPDGTCAPVVAGKQPPLKADGSGSGACRREAEDTCGFTGTCDGEGACAEYDSSTVCGESTCVGSTFYEVLTCDGAGSCVQPEGQECAPYVGCNPVSGCATSCAIDADCINGYSCEEGECQMATDEPGPGNASGGGGGDDGGCNTTGSGISFVLLMMGLGLVRRRVQP